VKSILNPPASIGVAIGTMGVVFAIYAVTVPNLGTIHATSPHDINVDAARKKAAITAGVAAGAVAILSRDLNPWILGGGAIVISDMFVRHANITHPETGKMVATTDYGQPVQDTGNYAENYGSGMEAGYAG
jgi:hypothetical protein